MAGAALKEAMALAAQGRAAEAVACLERHAARGDGIALYGLALWRIEGRLVPRDLLRARDELGRAAAAGVVPAGRTLAALMTTGAGGTADFAGALALLGRLPDEDARRQVALVSAMRLTAEGDPLDVPPPEVLNEEPLVARFPALFTAAECGYLTRAAEPRFRQATIFHEGQQRFVADPIRDSDAAGFPLVSEGPAVHALNRRLAAASGTDVRRGEPLQVLRYAPGQQYRPHLDALPTLANQRVLTFLVYLNDDYRGGETEFPELNLRVRGTAGMGLLFANALPDGRPDPRMRHAGLPVQEGAKLVASRWIRAQPQPADGEGFGPHEAMRKR